MRRRPRALTGVLAVLPPEQAGAVREACLPRGGRLRFAVDGTPCPRPDAECSPGRWHVHHDACRCDGARKTILLPDTSRYGDVRLSCWRHVHPMIHGDRTYFAAWDGPLPIVKGDLVRVQVEHLPDGRKPSACMWLWHAGPTTLPIDEIWRACLARFDEEHSFKTAKGVLGLIAAKLRTPEQTDRWVHLVVAAFTQLALARDLTTDLRRPWEKPPHPDRPTTPGRVRRGFRNIRCLLGTPPMSRNPPRPDPDDPKDHSPAQPNATPSSAPRPRGSIASGDARASF
ncbi:hypothetical protein ACGFNU_34135 [Spirillospora sp. NPDC048911]|uniref:hypothetical protein n=1 Tax=Spirillospora sp. NPDC048911 TaxID=3364527 RepID=UPI00371B7FFE